MSLKEKVKDIFSKFIDESEELNLAEEVKADVVETETEVKLELNAPDGDYTSADGGVITVSENSISYSEAAAEEEAVVEEEEAPAELAEDPKVELSEAEKQNEILLASIEELKTKVTELEKVEKISAAPQKAKPVTLSIPKNASQVEMAQFNFIQNRLNK